MKKLPTKIIRRRRGEPARESVLRILKLQDEMTIAELCGAMNVTYTAVRRQLSSLQQEGLISSRPHNQGTGRPIAKYRLSESAADHFPTGYENLAAGMLETVFEQGGHPGIMEFLRTNNDRIIRALLPRFEGKTLAQRVEEIARYFDENGYMTKWTKQKDGNFFLYHQNCAVYKLAVRYRQLCILEPRLIEFLLGVKVTRQQYILKKQPICGYFVDSKRPLFVESGQK